MTETDPDPAAIPLFDRIYAAMVAGAIGDAMGGPVEGWTYQRIQETHGIVDDLLPYESGPDYHNHFRTAPGSVTDDTRLKHLVAEAMVAEVETMAAHLPSDEAPAAASYAAQRSEEA